MNYGVETITPQIGVGTVCTWAVAYAERQPICDAQCHCSCRYVVLYKCYALNLTEINTLRQESLQTISKELSKRTL